LGQALKATGTRANLPQQLYRQRTLVRYSSVSIPTNKSGRTVNKGLAKGWADQQSIIGKPLPIFIRAGQANSSIFS